MVCSKCHVDNPDSNKFCGACGAALTAAAPETTVIGMSSESPAMGPIAVPGDPGAFYCARHKKAVTRLRCGRCEKPICPRCTVLGPAGARCRDCARNKIAVRPLGVLNEAGRIVDNVANSSAGNRVWYLALWYIILSFFRGFGD